MRNLRQAFTYCFCSFPAVYGLKGPTHVKFDDERIGSAFGLGLQLFEEEISTAFAPNPILPFACGFHGLLSLDSGQRGDRRV